MRALAVVMLALWLWEALLLMALMALMSLMAVMSVSQGQHHVAVSRRLSVIRDRWRRRDRVWHATRSCEEVLLKRYRRR